MATRLVKARETQRSCGDTASESERNFPHSCYGRGLQRLPFTAPCSKDGDDIWRWLEVIMFRRVLRLILPLIVVPTVFLPAAPATGADVATSAPGNITVVHGVRGLVADVRLDGKLVLSGFAPQRVTDPMAIPAGPHRVQIWPSGAAASSKPALDTVVSVIAGSHATLAVGLSSQGQPQITPFDDNLASAGSGATPFAVRNIAATPAVRVTVDAKVVADAIVAPQQEVTSVAPGNHTVAVLPPTSSSPLFPPDTVPTVAGRATALYLIGSAKDSSLGWVAQTIRPVSPSSVQTGVGALGQRQSDRTLLGRLIFAVLLLAGIVEWRLARRRRQDAMAQ